MKHPSGPRPVSSMRRGVAQLTILSPPRYGWRTRWGNYESAKIVEGAVSNDGGRPVTHGKSNSHDAGCLPDQ